MAGWHNGHGDSNAHFIRFTADFTRMVDGEDAI